MPPNHSSAAASTHKNDLRALRLAYRTRNYLLRIPDVLGYAVGFRIRDGERTHEPALIVYVREGVKRRDPSKVARHRRIPRHVNVRFRSDTKRLPVDLVESAPAELCTAFIGPGETVCNCAVPQVFGTVGWVGRQVDTTPVFVSCFHVLLARHLVGGNELLFIHDPAVPETVTTPSVTFGGNAGVQTGLVLRGVRTHSADLAIGQALGGAQLTSLVSGIGPLGEPRILRTGEVIPGQGEEIQVAVGHDGPITGRLLESPARFTINYPDAPGFQMDNLIATSADVREGDSGSALLDAAGQPLGLLVARDPLNRRSYFMPIATVMSTFNLRRF